MAQRVRGLRHWKQRFDPNAEFVLARSITWNGQLMAAGDEIPAELARNRNKLQRFWEAGTIRLAKFVEPEVSTGKVDAHAHATLLGSSTLDSEFKFGDKVFTLGDVVCLAYERTDLSVDEWNDLEDAVRDSLLDIELNRLQEEHAPSEINDPSAALDAPLAEQAAADPVADGAAETVAQPERAVGQADAEQAAETGTAARRKARRQARREET